MIISQKQINIAIEEACKEYAFINSDVDISNFINYFDVLGYGIDSLGEIE